MDGTVPMGALYQMLHIFGVEKRTWSSASFIQVSSGDSRPYMQ